MRWFCVFVVFGFTFSHLRAEVLVATDTGRPFHPVQDKSGRVTGTLPGKWHDNSSWAQVWVDYSATQDAGRSYLRIQVNKVDDGRAQLMHDLPPLDTEAYYRLRLVGRSPVKTPIQIGIRFAGPPYTMAWEDSAAFEPAWSEHRIDFRLAKQTRPLKLMILMGGAGEVHLASLTLERRTREELLEDIRKQYTGPAPYNLVRQTTFPLGMPCGWSLHREYSDGDEVAIGTGQDGVVPGGAPLAVKPRDRFKIYSAPFDAGRAFDPHTASIHVRGEGEGKIVVQADQRWIASKVFKSTSQWTRVAVPFKPGLLAKAHVIHIDGRGTLEFDGFQVNVGEKPTDFHLQQTCEAHLGIESPARVFFDDEPVKLSYAIVGKLPQGSRLKTTLQPAIGAESPGEVVDAHRAPRGTLDLTSRAGSTLGPFRIEVNVVDSRDHALSPVSELVFYRLRKPRYWGKDAPGSPFGTHTLAATRHLLMAKSVGVNWVRLHDAGTAYAGWRYVEKEKGKWTFNDEPLQRYRRHNLKILGALATSPDWATNIQKPHNSYFDQFYQPRDLADYANYVKVITSRYKGVIDTWDVWNEPWNHEWWAIRYDEEKGKTDPRLGYITSDKPEADFARMVDVAVKAAREVDSGLRVLGVNSTTDIAGRKWTDGIVEAGGHTLPPIYCYHQYTSAHNLFPGDSVQRGFNAAMGRIREALGGKIDRPVWMTEGSAMRDRIGSGMYRHTFPGGAGEDYIATSDSLCRYVVSLLANGCQKVFLYSMHGHNSLGNGGEWRVLVTDEGYLHPSAAAHSNMAWHLDDTRFVKRIEIQPGVGAYLFSGAGRSVAVLSSTSAKAVEHAPLAHRDLKVVDIFGNPTSDSKTIGATLVYVTVQADANRLEALLTGK